MIVSNIPISDDDAVKAPFYNRREDSEEIKYLLERRKKLGGFLPRKKEKPNILKMPEEKVYEEFFKGSGNRELATTMAVVQLM